MSDTRVPARGGRLQMPRSRGAASGFLLILLGAWGALIPFVGPYFDFAFTPDQEWTWTVARGWLEVLPGAATALGGLCFLHAMSLSPYWQANPYLAWGLLLGLIAIPLYFDSLLHALTRAVTEARHANEAKSRFLAYMSHEFRTPLNGL